MERNTYLNKGEHVTPEEFAEGIIARIVTFEELQNRELTKPGNFLSWKQKKVREILAACQKEEQALAEANTAEQLKDFIRSYPNSRFLEPAIRKLTRIEIEEKAEQQRKLDEIKKNVNESTPSEIRNLLSENELRSLCSDLGLEYDVLVNYTPPQLRYNETPQAADDIPSGYTDVFFWGMPASGKTCALSAIFNTIKTHYTMDAPRIKKKFGATYRDDLVNIFKTGIGYLPDLNPLDKTQYMPVLVKKRDEKKYRQISFFELSGEIFKYFYKIVNKGSTITVEDAIEKIMQDSFRTLQLLLESQNQKIHFFFIDYSQETKGTKDVYGLTQTNYLESAATYFRDNDDIFKKKTDAVYVLVTKADVIRGNEKTEVARKFLYDDFGSFMDVLQNRCKRYSIEFTPTIFSIGDVYFKRICKINREYAKSIIDELLDRVKPVSDNTLIKFLNR